MGAEISAGPSTASGVSGGGRPQISPGVSTGLFLRLELSILYLSNYIGSFIKDFKLFSCYIVIV